MAIVLGLDLDLGALVSGSDLRGVALAGIEGEEVNLTPDIAGLISCGFLRWLSRRLDKRVSELRVGVGRDSRLSGPDLMESVTSHIVESGASVYDYGLATTPMMFMSCVLEGFEVDGAIMITASHLPWNRNGFKLFTAAGSVEASEIKEILAFAEEPLREPLPGGGVLDDTADLREAYCGHLRSIVTGKLGPGNPLGTLSVAVDAGNGASGFYATDVLAPLGADVSASQYLEPDGRFPHHMPNPEDEEAMASISRAVLASHADLGIIFDTDGDRVSAVDEHGCGISRDSIVALAATLVAEEHPGTTVVTDSVTSDELTDYLERVLGVRQYRYRRGYRNVIGKMHELNESGVDCALAIETSGHAAFIDNYALDDGAYLATLIVCAAARLKRQGRGLSELLQGLERPAEEREIRMRITAADFRSRGAAVLEAFSAWASEHAEEVASEAAGSPVSVSVVEPNYEGVRIAFSGVVVGWALLRVSLHDPNMPLNMASSRAGGLRVIEQTMRGFLAITDGVDASAL